MEVNEKFLEEEARKLKNEYQREYNRKNRERRKAANERYWIKLAKQKLEGELNEKR